MKFKQSFQWICYSLSIFATLLSPISLIGIVDTAYHNGYRNFVAQFGIILALPILYWILKRIISYEDVFEFIEDRFGIKVILHRNYYGRCINYYELELFYIFLQLC